MKRKLSSEMERKYYDKQRDIKSAKEREREQRYFPRINVYAIVDLQYAYDV